MALTFVDLIKIDGADAGKHGNKESRKSKQIQSNEQFARPLAQLGNAGGNDLNDNPFSELDKDAIIPA